MELNTQETQDQVVNTAPSEIDWTNISPETVPVDVIKSHPLYKKVLGEAIERRQELSKQKQPAKVEEPQANQDAGTTNPDPIVELTAKLTALDQKLSALTGVQREAERNKWAAKAESETGLKGTILQTINAENEQEYLAKAKAIASELGIKPLILGSGSAGNVAADEEQKAVLNRVVQRFGQKDVLVNNPFDIALQRRMRGGGL